MKMMTTTTMTMTINRRGTTGNGGASADTSANPPLTRKRSGGVLPRPMATAIGLPLLILATLSHAETTSADTGASDNTESNQEDWLDLEEIRVTAPEQTPSEAATQVLDQQSIQGNRSQSLGALLESMPGVSNASFGQGVARPVVRGLSGNRVQILTNGADSADLSAMSSDHAPMADLAAANQVELVRGPAAFRFGSGILGGIVNVQDQRIHDTELDGINGEVTLGYSSNDQGWTRIARLDAGNGQTIVHIDGFDREGNNYHAGANGAQSGDRTGEILNSDTSSQGMALGLSRIFDNYGYIGLSISNLSSDYAVPNEDNDDTRVAPDQTRYDLRAELPLNSSWAEAWRLQLGWSDYEHDELTDDLVVGLFIQEFREWRTELDYQTESGWVGTLGIGSNQRNFELCHDHSGCEQIADHSDEDWDGTQGSDFTLYEGYKFAHDTPMPATVNRDIIGFWHADQQLIFGQLSLGGRIEQRQIEADETVISASFRQDESYYKTRQYTPVSLSASLTYDLNDVSQMIATLSRLQRAPTTDELYWNGDHHATFSFQLDNPDLKLETARALDISWQSYPDANASQWRISGYFYDYQDYIYNDLKEFTDPYHGNRVYRHEQTDARLAGVDATWVHPINEQWGLDMGASLTRGWLVQSGDDLPRMPADNLMLAINHQHNTTRLRAEVFYHARQTRVTAAETISPDWYQLNLSARTEIRFANQTLRLDAQLRNLTDQYGEQHTSYLKEYAPVMGRNLLLELQWPFGNG
ncbi:TonB-dependent receptor [Oceanobacter sp. 5_MG-2023]|uniref:TonB-dependent receptor n=1 Tax=Oceanobacter sp. 5_MG-2023 TaxID=3062645 RepID=UPI0026E2B043|nr:TonB-dependent receptor plug domain-containing protein [Oceanobacter sp. 5_MG-2023]MDO6682460.1 TonB-dependent receptor [Oceanobacter sp. 5_MG-2023]